MIDVAKLEAIARDLRRLLPEGSEQFQQGVRKNLRLIAESVLERMDLVTREEFDAQQALLIRTREKLEALERKLADLERTTPPQP
jgi:BMFP domain-containing protein YqiC